MTLGQRTTAQDTRKSDHGPGPGNRDLDIKQQRPRTSGPGRGPGIRRPKDQGTKRPEDQLGFGQTFEKAQLGQTDLFTGLDYGRHQAWGWDDPKAGLP